MQAQRLLHRLLNKSSAIGHVKRLDCLLRAVDSVTHEGKLSLTSIGRHLAGQAKVKHKIKSVDKLLGNERLRLEREGSYAVLACTVLSGLKEVLVLVDWSPCGSHKYHLLKASVVLKGRSITLYEEVHPEGKLGDFEVHKRFLEKLKEKIPRSCQVIIETDAGFRTEWFELVLEMGWNFIGRIRSNMVVKFKEAEWVACSSLYSKAVETAKYLGNGLLSKARLLDCAIYLYHEKKANKEKVVKRKFKSRRMDARYSRAHKEPWLLATSLQGGQIEAKQLVIRYRKRMKIEHEFRDIKNGQWGVGLEYSRTKDIERLKLLLLIGHLAIFLLWVVGLAGEEKKLHYHYQANTIKRHRVLSLVFLGLQILLHDPGKLNKLDILNAFNEARKSFYE